MKIRKGESSAIQLQRRTDFAVPVVSLNINRVTPHTAAGNASGWEGAGMSMAGLCRGVLAFILAAQLGCGAIQKPSWDKPWGKGAAIAAGVCCAAGTGIGILIQNERRGTSTLIKTNPDGGQEIRKVKDDRELWKGALIGCAVGIPVCGVLGHIFLDPAAAVEPTPPPVPTGEELPPGGVEVKPKRRIVLRGVYFDFDRSDIRPDSRPVLDEAAEIVTAARQDIEQLVVEGHTDAQGTDEYNQALSIRRAEAVFRYLINGGVPPELMRIEGYGESRPVASNEDEEGRAQNRRVELRVLP
jgi:OOP family OmpA-OmpF porin